MEKPLDSIFSPVKPSCSLWDCFSPLCFKRSVFTTVYRGNYKLADVNNSWVYNICGKGCLILDGKTIFLMSSPYAILSSAGIL